MSIPSRWLPCPRKGRIIAESASVPLVETRGCGHFAGILPSCNPSRIPALFEGKFLPFKTPLSSQYDSDVPEENRFDVPMLVMYVEAMQLRMGLVIDLTKTGRYYDKRDLVDKRNIGHYKLECEGFGETPTPEQVNEFKRVCSHYFEQNPGEIVGVHCTHGFNRTGFLIISYLVEVEDWSLEASLAAFIEARPPGIYKGEYLKVLALRYNNGNMEDVVVPEKPQWCFEEETEGEEEMGGTSRKRKRGREIQNETAKFMDGVSGPTLIGPPKREDIQQQCQYILKWDGSGFPGSQPVSMDVQNISFLHKKPYRVSWKADGTRYLMYICGPGAVYMLDRDNAVFLIPHLMFPARGKPGVHLKETLLDGEMVMDKGADGSVRPRYLVYDVMMLENKSEIAESDHKTRMSTINKEVIEPREDAARHGVLDKMAEPFSVRAKMFWDLSIEAMEILVKFVKTLSHENDGFIFSPGTDPYVAGRCNDILKWKPADMNSVDFRLALVERKQQGELPTKVGQLFVGGYKEPFSTIDLKTNKEVRHLNGRIIECSWDPRSGWHFMRVREDKNFPNSYTTAMSVAKSIRQPVTREWLHTVIRKIPTHLRPCERHTRDTELMPPPRIKPRVALNSAQS